MNPKVGDIAAAQRNGYEPTSNLIQEQDCDTLLLYLPGFRKEQLRLQLAKSGTLRVSGTRPIGDDKSSSFQKDYSVSPNCDTTNITAKFEGGILYIRQPKLIVPTAKEDEKSPVFETQPALRPAEQRPPTPIPSRPEKDQEDDTNKKTSSADFREKSKPKEDTKPVDRGNASETEKTGGIDDDQRAEVPSITDQREEFSGNTQYADTRTGNYYKLVAAGKASKLMKSVKMVYMVMAIVLAFAFGMYVNSLIWCTNKPEN